jgi:hypothetical protein
LAQEPVDDVIAAVEKMQEIPRQAGEPSLPEIGVFLAVTHAATVARENRVVASHGEDLVRRRCANCGRLYSDFAGKGASPGGICRARVMAEGGQEMACNGQLVEIWRQAA